MKLRRLMWAAVILWVIGSLGVSALVAQRAMRQWMRPTVRHLVVQPRMAHVFTQARLRPVAAQSRVQQSDQRPRVDPPLEAPDPFREEWTREVRFTSRSVMRIWQDYTLRAGDNVRDVVVIDGVARIDGEVWGDVVEIFGPVTLGSTAVIHGSLVVVAGSATVAEGARVRDELVVVGGTVEAPLGFSPGGEHIIIGATNLGDRLRQVLPWVSNGLLLGRLIVPSLGWMWGLMAFALILTLAINLLLHGPITRCAEILAARPFSTFFAGLMTLLLTGPISLLLTASVIGIVVVPFFLCAVLVAWIAGRVGVARWIGRSVTGQTSPETRLEGLRSVAIGFVAVCLVYMVPVIGLLTWALIGVFGLGAASLTFIGALRRERPKAAPAPTGEEPPVPPVPPVPPSPTHPSSPLTGDGGGYPAMAFTATPDPVSDAVPGAASAGGAAFTGAGSGTAAASPDWLPSFSHPRPGAPVTTLTSYPHATFLDRLAAGVVDICLILIANGFLVPRLFARNDGFVFLLAFAYFVAFWAWKQTTVGGIVCNLRLTRTDGVQLGPAEAVVRGLASIFSFFALGLGFLWILRDPERQAWHDKVAGTYVVKVPANMPLS